MFCPTVPAPPFGIPKLGSQLCSLRASPPRDEGLWHPREGWEGCGLQEAPVERCAWFGSLTGGLGESSSQMERGGWFVKVRKAPVPAETFLVPWGAHGEHPSAPAGTL